ncbi:MAG: cell division protein FtsQ/DivIB [Pseudomonadota bacterium]
MRSLIHRRAGADRPDPAPSRLAYRVQRLLLTPLFHSVLRVGIPAFLLAFGAGWLLRNETLREDMMAEVLAIRTSIENRPEFMVAAMAITGASEELIEDIHEVVPIDFPITSFALDLEAMRDVVLGLDAVAEVDLSIQASGILAVDIVERTPAVVWQTRQTLEILDAEGHRVGPIDSRAAHAALPLVAGEGGDRAVPEALRLLAMADELEGRVIGLQRMGARRWDVVLTEDQRILLPETGAELALARVMALDAAQELFERDISAVDLRLPDRPTIRLNPDALDALWDIRGLSTIRSDQ